MIGVLTVCTQVCSIQICINIPLYLYRYICLQNTCSDLIFYIYSYISQWNYLHFIEEGWVETYSFWVVYLNLFKFFKSQNECYDLKCLCTLILDNSCLGSSSSRWGWGASLFWAHAKPLTSLVKVFYCIILMIMG